MPYSEQSENVYNSAILPALSGIPEVDVLVLRADRMGPREITIKAHVESIIKSADWCIADLTGLNPNVMYEVGFANAIGVPALFIMSGDPSGLPADLRNVLVIRYSKEDLAGLRGSLTRAWSEAIARRVAVADPKKSWLATFEEAIRTRCWVLSSSAKSLLELVLPAIQRVRAQDLVVRLICPNPESSFILEQARERGMEVAGLRSQEWRTIDELSVRARGIISQRIEIRLIENPPTARLFLADRIAFLQPILFGVGSQTDITWVVNERQMIETIEQSFEKAWAQAAVIKGTGARL